MAVVEKPIPTEAQRQRVHRAIEALESILPAQAPLRDFVHHNTLHGFEQLPFHQAIAAASRYNGNSGYYPQEQWRDIYDSGRITTSDLEQALAQQSELHSDELLAEFDQLRITRGQVQQLAMRYPFHRLSQAQLNWQLEELLALERFAADIPQPQQQRLLRKAATRDPREALQPLWDVCLQQLGLSYFTLHPEDAMELEPEQADILLSQMLADASTEREVRMGLEFVQQRAFRALSADLLEGLGPRYTLRSLLLKLTGIDILQDSQSLLVRQMGNYLDLGIASLRAPDQHQGFFAVWRETARHDPAWFFEDLPKWQDYLEQLPQEPVDAIIAELQMLGIAEADWQAYLRQLALELPGWSGMFLWREEHHHYAANGAAEVRMADYLAVRLIVETVYARKLCESLWQLAPTRSALSTFFNAHRSEFLVRYELFNTQMPDFLASLAQRLVDTEEVGYSDELHWTTVAQLIWIWQHRQSLETVSGHSIFGDAWYLFRLCQHLGICATELASLQRDQVEAMLAAIQQMDAATAGQVWLAAYEHHYREQLLQGLRAAAQQAPQPQLPLSAQLVLCMDDREEGFRRHLEEQNPDIDTFGAAAFFDLDLAWQGLDDEVPVKLCPVPMTPGHLVRETPVATEAAIAEQHRRKHRRTRHWYHLFYQELRRNLLTTVAVVMAAAPVAMTALFSRIVFPRVSGRQASHWEQQLEGVITTDVSVSRHDSTVASPLPEGYSDNEQAAIVAGFLRKIGLTDGFAPLVLLMGHGSNSENNPHFSAYGCGACSGRYSGPNGRIFAAMANRSVVRRLLAEQSIFIPESTWFLGAERNTCSDRISLFDRHRVPVQSQPALERLIAVLAVASEQHAQERCRKFMTVPLGISAKQAYQHVLARSLDISQPRPELGHATVAAAIIGRRQLSRQLFLDRRVFLISYDPDRDEDGTVLEQTLLLTTPVGAGIALEYYFSSVDPVGYGSGSKITHNIVGLFGVMDGASSDLRTGLPRQMTEIHEPMRLQVVIEASIERLMMIVSRQPVLQRLIDNAWINLSSLDPHSGAIHNYVSGEGFRRWQGEDCRVPTAGCSTDWYAGTREPLQPAIIHPGAVRDA